MAEMKVKLVDQAGKEIEIALPDDRKISALTAAISRKLNLPATDDRGRLQMVLNHKVSGRDLNPDRTLSEEKVQDGDILRFRLDAIAGNR